MPFIATVAGILCSPKSERAVWRRSGSPALASMPVGALSTTV